MTAIEGAEDAIALAERLLLSEERPKPEEGRYLAEYVALLANDESPREASRFNVQNLTHLARLLLAVGMREQSRDVVLATLRDVELSEADKEWHTSADLWHALGTLLSEHDLLDHARTVLGCALRRTHHSAQDDERPGILADLAVVSLRAGDLRSAQAWAEKAQAATARVWQEQPEARLNSDRVLVDVALARQDIPELGRALVRFEESTAYFVEREGHEHPRAISSLVALAEGKYQLASALHDVAGRERELSRLELLRLHAPAVLGMNHREAIIAQAALAAAEFDAAGESSEQEDGPESGGADNPRRTQSVKILNAAVTHAQNSLLLGRDHSETRALRRALTDMRTVVAPEVELPYTIDMFYTPLENRQRNEAKLKALHEEREGRTIRLIAHGGASYFLSELSFYSSIVEALRRGVKFQSVISNPWNTLALFLQRGPLEDRPSQLNIVESVERSNYYVETFQRVIGSYLDLREEFPDLMELRLTSVDIPTSTLLTSDQGFLEPYITSNPEGRTRRGLGAFEVMFGNSSQYYVESVREFERQWELASTWQQFCESEEQHKRTLRSSIDALADVQLSKGVRGGAERHF